MWYDIFMDTLHKKFQKKSQLTKELIVLLNLEREAVYRRIRKEVSFSTQEIVKIVTAWGVSLDEIAHINSEQFSFQMRPMNYLKPSKKEQDFLKFVIQGIYNLQNFPDSELMEICNKFPRCILAGFELLNKFHLFKWKYQYGDEKTLIPFAQIIISEEEKNLIAAYYDAIKFVSTTNIVWDKRIFEYLINDINYFYSIYLITEEEKEMLKKELYALLDYWIKVANKGCYPETQKKVNLFISHLNIETNYTYIFSPESSISFIAIFEKFEIFSLNSELTNSFIAWMQWKKRTSTQISEVDEKSRIEFFTTQRQLVDNL
jgi:hypothetical protein